MGLDAYVPCRCPQDEDCPHPHHWYADERIGNWFACREFQAAIETAGRARFPVLDGLLPDGNHGVVEPEDAAAAMLELDVFTALSELGRRADLYDGDGELRYTGSPAYGGSFHFDGGVRVGFDERGIFVAGNPSEVVFPRLAELGAPPEGRVDLGPRVRQELRPDGRTRLVADVADGAPVRACTLPSPVLDGAPVLEIRTVVAVPADHDALVTALRKVLAAAVALDEPLVWI